jgi:hypothetical protein
MSRRVWGPAVNGNRRDNIPPVIAGMHFHDLRHTHKTWLIEDDIPQVAQAKRLGHRLPGVRGIYSHATPACNNASSTPSNNAGSQPAEHRQPRHRPTTPSGMTTNGTDGAAPRRRPAPFLRPPAGHRASPTRHADAIDDGDCGPHAATGCRETILCSQFAPIMRSRSKTARYRISSSGAV